MRDIFRDIHMCEICVQSSCVTSWEILMCVRGVWDLHTWHVQRYSCVWEVCEIFICDMFRHSHMCELFSDHIYEIFYVRSSYVTSSNSHIREVFICDISICDIFRCSHMWDLLTWEIHMWHLQTLTYVRCPNVTSSDLTSSDTHVCEIFYVITYMRASYVTSSDTHICEFFYVRSSYVTSSCVRSSYGRWRCGGLG